VWAGQLGLGQPVVTAPVTGPGGAAAVAAADRYQQIVLPVSGVG